MKSSRYPIPLNKLREGAELCLKNAQRLYHGGNSSVASNMNAERLSLLILSAEEVAKGLVIQEKLNKKESITKSCWEKWTRGSAHMKRLKHVNKKLKEAFNVDFFAPFSEKEVNSLKQFGFYVDWKENREWSVFFEKLDKETANLLYQKFVQIAESAIKLLKDNLFRCKIVAETAGKDENEEETKRRLRELGYL